MFSLNENHGVADLILYPSINLLPIALGHLFIKSNIVLIYLFIDLNVFISLLCTYYGSLYLTREKLSSFILSIIYSISFPFLSESFFNTDLGVLTAMAFLPLAVFGFIKMISNKNKSNTNNYLEFAIGTTLIIYSHILTAVILCMFIGLYTLINLKHIHKRQYINIMKSIIIIILLTSIIYLPAIVLTLNQHGQIAPPDIRSLYGQNFMSIFKSSITGYTTAYINIFAIIGVFLPLIFYKKLDHREKQLYWISLVILFVCSNLFPWGVIDKIKIFKPLMILQFTWRLYIIPELLLDYLFSICAVKFMNNKITDLITLISMLFVFTGSFYGQRWYIQHVPNIMTYKSYKNYKTIIPISKKQIHVKDLKINMHKSPLMPKYKVSNNRDLRELTLPMANITGFDYYPQASVVQFNNIKHNTGLINNKYHVYIHHYAYNEFNFSNKYNAHKLILPIVDYNKEDIRTYLDGKSIDNHMNRNNMLVIHNINKGNHILKVQYVPNKILIGTCAILFILGIVFMMIHIVCI